MDKEEFERRLLDLWVSTAIPLTRANLQVHTGEPAKRVKLLLEQLVVDGTLSVDTDGAGELVFAVPGAARADDGPRTFAEKERLDRLRAEVQATIEAKQALVVAAKAAAVKAAVREPPAAPAEKKKSKALVKVSARDALEIAGAARSELARGGKRELARGGKGELVAGGKTKSYLWAGGLSFVAGPLGWLYAGAFREAVPAAIAYLALAAILMKLPSVLVAPLMSIALPVSGLVGVIYAWQYNRHGKRQKLFDKSDEDKGKG